MTNAFPPQILRLVHRARPAGRRSGRRSAITATNTASGRITSANTSRRKSAAPPRPQQRRWPNASPWKSAKSVLPGPQPRGPLHHLPSGGGRPELRRLPATPEPTIRCTNNIPSRNSAAPSAIAARAAPPPLRTRTATCRTGTSRCCP